MQIRDYCAAVGNRWSGSRPFQGGGKFILRRSGLILLWRPSFHHQMHIKLKTVRTVVRCGCVSLRFLVKQSRTGT